MYLFEPIQQTKQCILEILPLQFNKLLSAIYNRNKRSNCHYASRYCTYSHPIYYA